MKKIIHYILLALLISISFSVIGTTAVAVAETTEYAPTFTPTTIPKPDLLPGPDIEASGARKSLVDTILPYFGVAMVGIVGTASLLFLLVAGVRFSMAYGNDEAIQKAKDQAMYALVGLVLAILSYAIVRIITNIKYEEAELVSTSVYHSLQLNQE